jgi:hypothetical protein
MSLGVRSLRAVNGDLWEMVGSRCHDSSICDEKRGSFRADLEDTH